MEPSIAVLRDSEDVRRFIMLSSYQADLTEALTAVDWALDSRDTESPTAGAFASFIGYAAVAYCRSFMPSKVRQPITEHIDIPEDWAATHELVRRFRNTTVAHSQSELATTFPIATFADELEGGVDVGALTVRQTLPWTAVGDFAKLVKALIEAMDELIHPIRLRLAIQAKQQRESGDSADPTRVSIVEKFASDFTARSTRRPYPTRHTIYWEPAD